MLLDLHVSPDPKQVGYYAGVIESEFKPNRSILLDLTWKIPQRSHISYGFNFSKGLFAVAQVCTGEI